MKDVGLSAHAKNNSQLSDGPEICSGGFVGSLGLEEDCIEMTSAKLCHTLIIQSLPCKFTLSPVPYQQFFGAPPSAPSADVV